ncbi:MAG: lasso peptide biosynthesis B2 protein [Planctomycetes bacterium]|nr:lasso peptide biosynthesis B2 protein [Planctomycetota bacterium]
MVRVAALCCRPGVGELTVLGRLRHVYDRARRAGPDGRLLLAEAFVASVVVRAALSGLPYAAAARVITRAQPLIGRRPREPRRIVWAVRVAAARVPGATCLVQALVGQALLARSGRSSAVRFGVRRGAAGVEAHAWLEHEGSALVGADERYAPFEGVRA